jgi:hypothetical protein
LPEILVIDQAPKPELKSWERSVVPGVTAAVKVAVPPRHTVVVVAGANEIAGGVMTETDVPALTVQVPLDEVSVYKPALAEVAPVITGLKAVEE